MLRINIDSKQYEVANHTKNLLETCLSLNLDIPYFCWHPALGSVGSCRVCAVKQYQHSEDPHGSLVMSCMTPISDNSFFSIQDLEAQTFRKTILELLMTNHPHDCPVCEEAGNCHLQDMLIMTGHNYRSYRFKKRTYINQNLGPFISHEMNRCIVCYRCVRYYNNYADGKDFGVYGAHNNIYFGRIKDGVLENEFSGNLVEICPTGVFTDKTSSKHYSRKWDMQFAPSICQHCSVGCNISIGERYGIIRHIENRYHGKINHYFICDRGRFGYEYLNLSDRPQYPLEFRDGKKNILTSNQILNKTTAILRDAKKIIGIGSSRASIESNFALRELVGSKNFYIAATPCEQKIISLIIKILYYSGVYTPTLREIESYDAILILGEDITQTSARIALAVRQAVKKSANFIATKNNLPIWQMAALLTRGQEKKYPLFVTNLDQTALDDIATWSYYASIEDQARLGFAIAHMLNNNAPKVPNLDHEIISKAHFIAKTLKNAKKPLIISGSSSGSEELIKSAANVAKALLESGSNNVGITLLPSEVNSLGLGLLSASSSDQGLEMAFNEFHNQSADTLIILENDLYRFFQKTKIDQLLDNIKNIFVLDHQNTKTLQKAHFVFPVASFAESDGTVINNEVRAQRFFQVYDPCHYNSNLSIQTSWRWLDLIKCKRLSSTSTSEKITWKNLDDVIDACITVFPNLKGIKKAAPNSKFRIFGQKMARKSQRFSGETSMYTHINIHEPSTPKDNDSMFTFSKEGNNSPFECNQHIPFAWVAGWNSIQAWNKYQKEVGGTLRYGDSGIRLITSIKNSFKLSWFTEIPSIFFKKGYKLRIVPYYHLFGSEELSQKSQVIQQRIPSSYCIINDKDALLSGWSSINSLVELTIQNEIFNLVLYTSKKLSSGLIGLPLGFTGFPLELNGLYIDNFRILKNG
ncbi:MAG: NADH-quinone oxidoreductase subunit NuoG [Candidatus Dasytiphilus stammeri]